MPENQQAKESDPPSYSVRAVERVCDILDLLLDQPEGVSLGQVVGQTALPKSSAFRYLWTLEQRRYVQRENENAPFRLGRAFLRVRTRQAEVLAQHARPVLTKLSSEFDETISLGVLDSNRVTYLDILESSKSVRLAARVGDRYPIHCTAEGKAIAAFLSEPVVSSILRAEGMPRFTGATITSIEDFFAELETVRSNGYAVDNGENEIDGRAIAVPLLGTELPAAISLSSPISRFGSQATDRVASSLKQAAENIAAALTTGTPSFLSEHSDQSD